jgi:hypothetical protein
MGRSIASLWPEYARTLVGYLAVGVAFLPSGIAYALLKSHGKVHSAIDILLLALGLLLARVAWRWAQSATADWPWELQHPAALASAAVVAMMVSPVVVQVSGASRSETIYVIARGAVGHPDGRPRAGSSSRTLELAA